MKDTKYPQIEISLDFSRFTGGTELDGDEVGRHGTFDLSTDLYWALRDNIITKYDMTTGEIVETLAPC